MAYELFVRDDAGQRIAAIEDYQQLDTVLSWDGVGTWVLDLERSVAMDAGLVEGTRLEVLRDEEPLIAGPLIGVDRNWGPSADRYVAHGLSDDTWLADRLAMPRPFEPWTSDDQGIFESAEITYDTQTGPAETVMHAFVERNLGPSARPERRVPTLVMGVNHGRGKQITGGGRFQPVLELLRDAALASGLDLGFAITQVGDHLEFGVLQSVDRGLVFSAELGNLAAFTSKRQRPDATTVLVGGQTPPGNPRRLQERLSPSQILQWGRVERFLDASDTSGASSMADAATALLTSGIAVTLSPAAVEGIEFGRDYALGDKVSLAIDDELLTQVVREIRITDSDAGEVIVPTVGSPGASAAPQIFSELRALQRRVLRRERIAEVTGLVTP